MVTDLAVKYGRRFPASPTRDDLLRRLAVQAGLPFLSREELLRVAQEEA